jgi:nucleoside-triphosphatase
VGKTTLVQKIIERMGSLNMSGFYTTEIRSKGTRMGFQLFGLNGNHGTLAHVDIHSRHRVGKYGVNTDGFETFLKTLDLMNLAVELIVIDEIGKMELFSSCFRRLVCEVISSDKQVLASIPVKGSEFIQKIKKRPDIRLFEVTQDNRDHLIDEIMERSK